MIIPQKITGDSCITEIPFKKNKLKSKKMKKGMIILIMVVATISVSGQTLKGYTIGKKLYDSGSKYTTVAGVRGLLTASPNDNGIISMLLFLPTDVDGNIKNISKGVANNMRKSIENNFKIKFTTENVSGGIGYVANNERYGMIVTDDYINGGVNVIIMIVDKDLLNAKKKYKISNDF